MTNVELVQTTPDPEKLMAYIARVSNPSGQESPNYAKLLKYCIKNNHWSVFEHSTMTVEITTTLPIVAQILRHRSFCFQQFSARYADVSQIQGDWNPPELRRQDTKNRQNSTDDLEGSHKQILDFDIQCHFEDSLELYKDMLERGVAKECARMVLPQGMVSKLYMTGNCRSWIHYIELRATKATQKEHRDVAEACKAVFCGVYPTVAEALGWQAEGPCDVEGDSAEAAHDDEGVQATLPILTSPLRPDEIRDMLNGQANGTCEDG